MNIKKFNNNNFAVNSYIVYVGESKEAIIIDPAFNSKDVIGYIDDNNIIPLAIILTHGHIDHIAESLDIKNKYNIDLYCHELEATIIEDPNKSLAANYGYKDLSLKADILLKDKDIINLGPMKFEIIHTPGHTRGGICILSKKHMFTGDTLFTGSMGRTDLYSGNDEHMRASLYKLSQYNDRINIYPGHGPASTIGKEKKTNPFLKSL